MENLSFDQLPGAVFQLYNKLESIEKLLLILCNNPLPSLPQDQLLTIQQAAELLCLSVPTVYGLVSRQEIPVSKKGKRLYFSRQELTEWITSGRKKTIAEIEALANAHLQKKK